MRLRSFSCTEVAHTPKLLTIWRFHHIFQQRWLKPFLPTPKKTPSLNSCSALSTRPLWGERRKDIISFIWQRDSSLWPHTSEHRSSAAPHRGLIGRKASQSRICERKLDMASSLGSYSYSNEALLDTREWSLVHSEWLISLPEPLTFVHLLLPLAHRSKSKGPNYHNAFSYW